MSKETPMKLQYISDLHLERRNPKAPEQMFQRYFEMILEPSAPYLAAVGDLGYPRHPSYRYFLRWCSTRFQKIFVVAGNHEFYAGGSSIEQVLKQIGEICQEFPNVIFLEKQSYFLEPEQITICGSTLWSPSVDPRMNDWNYIYTESGKKLDIASVGKLHLDSVKWLESTLADIKGKVIVLTHHLPSFQLLNKKYLSMDNSGFVSDLEYLLSEKILAWICGHSHNSIEIKIGSTQLAINCLGYEFEVVEDFSSSKVLEIS